MITPIQFDRTLLKAPARRINSFLQLRIQIALAFLAVYGCAFPLYSQPAPQLTPIAAQRTPMPVANGTAKFLARYEPESKLRVTIGIRVPKLAEEEGFLAQLQDPASPNFHKYLTAQQWNDRFAPPAEDEQAVVDWLTSNGFTITKRFAHRLTVNAEAPVSVIEKALQVQINRYQVEGNTEFSNDRDPAIPANLENIVLMVGGLNSIQHVRSANDGNFHKTRPDYSPGPAYHEGSTYRRNGDPNALRAALQTRSAATGLHPDFEAAANGTPMPELTASGLIEPSDLFSSNGYNFGPLQNLGHCCNPTNDPNGPTPTTSIAIVGVGDFAESDLDGFLAAFPYLSADVTTIRIDGTPACCNSETTLDVEWSVASSNSLGDYINTSHVWVYEAANDSVGEIYSDFSFMLEDGHARVATASWGCPEVTCFDPLQTPSSHNLYNAMLGQGWTLIAGSGDHGSAGNCDDQIQVSMPASDQDFIAVGGTTLFLNGDGSFHSETAWTGNDAPGSCSTNHGGSGGGCSDTFPAPGYQSQPICGAGSRSVPDIALNANPSQAVFFNGSLGAGGGTSIAGPEIAGFMAQENSYLMSIGNECGPQHNAACAPIGEANYAIYKQGYASQAHQAYAPHDPFYDITSGCNSNDITALYEMQIFCARAGYDQVTGWGTFNALQLAWEMNWYYAADYGKPVISLTGPLTNPDTAAKTWFNNDQVVSWTVADTNNGVQPSVGIAGFSQAWDKPIADPAQVAHQGVGNAFYNGPQFPNGTSGSIHLLSAGEGCHAAYVEAWDNTGLDSGNQTYGLLCLDTVAPTVTVSTSPAANAAGWNNTPVQAVLTAADPGGAKASGVAKIYYAFGAINCAPGALSSCSVYNGNPLVFNTNGVDGLQYFVQDNANNFSTPAIAFVHLDTTPPVTKALLSGTQVSNSVFTSNVQVTLAATDNASGVASTTYRLDNGAQITYSGPFTVTGLGLHVLRFGSVDVAGNVESNSGTSFTIAQASTTTLSVSPNPAVRGQTITLTASVAVAGSPAIGGGVFFMNGATELGSGLVVNGTISLSIKTLPYGNNTLTAVYEGYTNVIGSTSAPVREDFEMPTATEIAASVDPAVFAQPVTLTARVGVRGGGRAIVTGWVQFYSGSTQLAFVPLTNGVATTVATLPVGTDPISAQYDGDVDYAPSSSFPNTLTVKNGSTTTRLISSPDPSQYLQKVTFAASVTSAYGAPTGKVSFANNGIVIGTGILSGGIATFTTSTLGVGSHNIRATYEASIDYSGSSSAVLAQTIGPAESQVLMTSSLNPASYGQVIQLPLTVSNPNGGLPSGTVELMDGTTLVSTATVTNGNATLIFRGSTLFAYPSAGKHSLTAVYTGSPEFLAGTSPVLIETVNPAVTTTAVTSSVNPATTLSKITFTVTVTPATGLSAPGTVIFYDGRVELVTATLSSSGVASFTVSGLKVGTHSIFAVYKGSANYQQSTSPVLNQVVNPLTF